MATSRVIPPGINIPHGYYEVVSGGSVPWQELPPPKLFTNAFVFDPPGQRILLGYKKRGFGKDMWNGFGGKVEPGETSLQAARRELQEEACIDAPLVHAGTLVFTTEGAEYAHHIDYFRADSYSGVPTETDEMRPAWFAATSPASLNPPSAPVAPEAVSALAASLKTHSVSINSEDGLPSVPYPLMWADDQYWFPLLVAGRKFIGRADFARAEGDGSQGWNMQRFWFGAEP